MKRDLGAGADSALKSFRRRKILTLEEVAGLIGRTVHTARRRLQEWQAHHSYNHNGRYYTLPDVPEYDAHGLWRWRGVFFSRAGTLKQTVIELVGRSAAGMDGGELRELLGLDPRSFLSAFADHPQLRREKTRGCFVYYYADPVMGARQRRQRSTMSARDQVPSEFEAIAILVEQIKRPALSVAALSRRLKARQLCVEPHRIQNVFRRQWKSTLWQAIAGDHRETEEMFPVFVPASESVRRRTGNGDPLYLSNSQRLATEYYQCHAPGLSECVV